MSSTDQESTRHGAYVAGVGAVVSVITQEEIAVRRNGERPEAALGRNLGEELDGAFTPFDPPMRGMSTAGDPRYCAVVLFALPKKTCAVAPSCGYHCARGTSASAFAAAIRASAARSVGWCSCA